MSLYTLSFLCAFAFFALQVPGKIYITRVTITRKTTTRSTGSKAISKALLNQLLKQYSGSNKGRTSKPRPANRVTYPGPNSNKRPNRGPSRPPSSPSVNPRDIVNKHNELRRGVKPTASNMLKMRWSKEFAANAQRWADRCTQKHSSKKDRRDKKFGENLYMGGSNAGWDNVIEEWHSEVERWQYGRGGKGVGHFTQIVWANSNLIGCGMAICPKLKYKYYYVCQYSPPGNYNYLFPYKKGRPCADCPNACENKLCTKR